MQIRRAKFFWLFLFLSVSCAREQTSLAESPQMVPNTRTIDCGKFGPQLQTSLATNPYVSQTLETLYFSPSLGSCIAVVYSVYPVDSPVAPASGEVSVEVHTVPLSQRLLLQNYSSLESGNKVAILADVNRQIREKGWGDE